MSAVDERVHHVEQPLFTAALNARINNAIQGLELAIHQGDSLVAQILAVELADLTAIADANGIDVHRS